MRASLREREKKSKVCSGSVCEGKGRHCKNSETTSLGGDGPVLEGAEHVNRVSSRKLAGACESSGERGLVRFHMPAHGEWTRPGHPDSCRVQTLSCCSALGRAEGGSWSCRSAVRLGTTLDVRWIFRFTTCTFFSVTPHQLSRGEGGIPAHPQVGLPWASSHLDHLEMKLLKAPELGV